jgi:hypothetical protein
VQDYRSQQVEDIDPFIWPFLRDNLAVCHCLFSGSAAPITPSFGRSTSFRPFGKKAKGG